MEGDEGKKVSSSSNEATNRSTYRSLHTLILDRVPDIGVVLVPDVLRYESPLGVILRKRSVASEELRDEEVLDRHSSRVSCRLEAASFPIVPTFVVLTLRSENGENKEVSMEGGRDGLSELKRSSTREEREREEGANS